jgi:hypothetical protein
MNKIYQIWLDNQLIGTSFLEFGDPPMGCVHGKIMPLVGGFGYDFIKDFYSKNLIDLAYDYPEDKIISTTATKKLRVLNPKGIEIESLGNQIYGMDGDCFEVSLEGVGYPFYEEEFPHHYAAYWKR